MTNIYAN